MGKQHRGTPPTEAAKALCATLKARQPKPFESNFFNGRLLRPVYPTEAQAAAPLNRTFQQESQSEERNIFHPDAATIAEQIKAQRQKADSATYKFYFLFVGDVDANDPYITAEMAKRATPYQNSDPRIRGLFFKDNTAKDDFLYGLAAFLAPGKTDGELTIGEMGYPHKGGFSYITLRFPRHVPAPPPVQPASPQIPLF